MSQPSGRFRGGLPSAAPELHCGRCSSVVRMRVRGHEAWLCLTCAGLEVAERGPLLVASDVRPVGEEG